MTVKITKGVISNMMLFTVIFWCFALVLNHFIIGQRYGVFFYMQVVFGSLVFAFFAELFSYNNCTFLMIFSFILSLSILCFVFVFRNGTAIDDRHYYYMFLDIANEGAFKYFQSSFVEPAYIVLLGIIRKFSAEYLTVQIITGLIPFMIIGISLYKMRKKVDIVITLFIFIASFYFQMISTNLSRMFFAIAIVYYCFDYLYEKKYKQYVIGIFIASTFHFSALFMLLFAYLAMKQREVEKKRYLVLMFMAIPLFFIMIAKYIAPLLGRRHGMYTVISSIEVGNVFGCIDKIPFIFVFEFFKRTFMLDDESRQWIDVSEGIYSFSLMVDFSSIFVNLGRLSYYTEIACVLGISILYKHIDSQGAKKLLLLIILVYGFLNMYVTQFALPSHAARMFPYINILFTIK